MENTQKNLAKQTIGLSVVIDQRLNLKTLIEKNTINKLVDTNLKTICEVD